MTEATAKKTAAKRAPRKPDPVTKILGEVRAEMEFVGHGTPLWGGNMPEQSPRYYAAKAANWLDIDLERCLKDRPGWDSRLIHSTFWAFADADPAKARERLLTVAAAAVAAIETIDRGPA
ncbi:hypothetical protein LKL35_26055 [Streptomyces sp. ET3-23]|uniref:hypothetical protein n=1 Tax=Streptomyces sp. ET3-23 TaxID=2885643 RepID=UPI001D116D39|nr:hypothetical protein [Streptomyces sp. ET3-23]MCC2278865.1 hypothetical protein [Streptomyces sp. ET3-23]